MKCSHPEANIVVLCVVDYLCSSTVNVDPEPLVLIPSRGSFGTGPHKNKKYSHYFFTHNLFDLSFSLDACQIFCHRKENIF